uniref:ENTH domain-containing protein n=1 Tax=Anas zonorhyncha TaxID=75864 RepID=A0A8B9W138_9AVES
MLTTRFMKNYSEARVKVREATSTNPWGSQGHQCEGSSELMHSTVSLSGIVDMIYHRMNDWEELEALL